MIRIRIVVFTALATLAVAPSAGSRTGAPAPMDRPTASVPVEAVAGAGIWECASCFAVAFGRSFGSPGTSGFLYGGCAGPCTMTF